MATSDTDELDRRHLAVRSDGKPRTNFTCGHREHERLTACPDYPLPDHDGEWEARRNLIRLNPTEVSDHG